MRSYSYGQPEGRKIGEIGVLMMYPRTLVRQGPELPPEVIGPNETTFCFQYGPSAGGLLEPVRFGLLTTGESIKCVSSDPMFKKRVLEVRGKRPQEALPLVERINGPFAAAHAIAFLSAVEDASGIEVDRTVLMDRIIELELERVRNHFHVLGRMCEAAAFGVPYNSIFYLREKVNRLIGKRCGHRYFHGVNGVGTITANFREVSGALDGIREEAEDLYETLRSSKIFVDRLQGNGVVRDPPCGGPVARGSGRPYDARADSDTLPYSELSFAPIVEEHGAGDAMDRFMVRFEEISQSMDLIRAAEEARGGSGVIPATKPCFGNGKGEGVGRVESPSGDLAYHVELEADKISRMDLLAPSRVNLPVFQRSAQGNVFTDFHFNWESFGIWISEIAVVLI